MPAQNRTGLFRYPDGRLPNLLALLYVLLGQIGGFTLLSLESLAAFLAGTLLVAHSLVIAGYLIHDLAHMLVFRRRRHNLILGEALSWVAGAAYAPFERIARMHMRHHSDRADIALFDHREFLQRRPRWVQSGVFVLEWLHIPAVELIMHYQVVLRPFLNPAFGDERDRVIAVGVSRILFFALLYHLSPWALLGQALAYLLFLKALFIADAYAHTYEAYIVARQDEAVPDGGRDTDYDRTHTWSNLVSQRRPWLNLLNLNFGYHNAHHDRPSVPWYRLPAQHRELYPMDSPQVLPYRELWRSLHRNRLSCILATDPGEPGSGPDRAAGFLGVHGVSFLSIV